MLTSNTQVFSYYRHKNVVRFFMILCVFTLFEACHSKQTPTKGNIDVSDQSIPEEVLECQEIFNEKNPEIKLRYGALNMVVRMATKNELPPDDAKLAAFFSAEGAGALALGFGYPTIFSSALVVGGAFLIPAGTYFFFHEKNIWNAISEAMSHAELTRSIAVGMQDRLKSQFADKNTPELKIEIIVKGFGLVKSKSGFQHCLSMSAECIVSQDGEEIGRDLLKITEEDRSDDAPPPQCAHLERFADHEARLLKVHLNELTQVLATMAIERLLKVREQ